MQEMNSQQFQSLVRAVLLVIGPLLIRHGITTDSTWTDIAGGLVTLAPLIWSWIYHGDPPADPPLTPIKPRIPGPLALLMAAALLAVTPFYFSGCKSTPQQAIYETAGTTIVGVDTAMNLWGAYVAAEHPGTNIESQVKAAFDQYQAAMTVFCDAGAAYAATGGTNGTATAALNQAAANASQNLLDLEKLIAGFGVKL
jgi:hypothetical protein